MLRSKHALTVCVLRVHCLCGVETVCIWDGLIEPIIESVMGIYYLSTASSSFSLFPNEEGMMEGTYGVQKV